ncbi:hypothetical protein TNCV_4987391 [Trichonephila clavipes]|nr:hypothetical protein TNCV_4987391 [Trichonephila clavipes]
MSSLWFGGRGSLVVKVTGSWLACHEFEQDAEDTPFRGGHCTLNLSKFKCPPVDKPYTLREGVYVHLSSTIQGNEEKVMSHLRDNKSHLSTGCRISTERGHCQVIYSQFGLAIHQNDHQARRRFVEWAQNEIAVVPDFHKRILFSDEAHFWLNGYVNKQNCRIWSEANPQVYVETPLHPEKLTVWCALWAGGILL